MGFHSCQGPEIFVFSEISRWLLDTNLLFSGYLGSFLGVKWLGHEADPSGADFKGVWSYTSTFPMCLV
jgi:hypothetical protein